MQPATPTERPVYKKLLGHLAHGYWIPYLVGLIGLTLLATAGIRFFGFQRGASLLAPAATCLAASTAGFVGLRGILTWTAQIKRDRLERSREAAELYMKAALKHLPQLSDDEDLEKQLEGRLAAVLWGSDETARTALSFAQHIARIGGSNSELGENDKVFGDLMLALRRELRGQTSLSAEDLVRTAFIK